MATSANNPHTARVIVLAVAGAVGGFLFGFDSSVVNGAVDALSTEFDLSQGLTGFAVASALIGCAFGAYAGGRIASRWGRIPAMVVGSIMFLVSSFGTGLAFSVWDLILWRVVGGLGIGIASVIAPAYIAEISPRQLRGRLASLQQLAITIGIFAALLSDALFARQAGGASNELWLGLPAWRWMFIAAAAPAIVYGVIALLLPESPRFLIQKGKDEQAKAILATIVSPDELDRSLRDIQESIAIDQRALKPGSLRGSAFGLKPIIWAGIALAMLQQFVGINVIFYYSTSLWQSVGFGESSSFTISVFTAVTNILVTLIAIALIDRVGRRPILLFGSAGMAVTLAVMAIAFSQAVTVNGAPSLTGAWGPIALIAANLFVVSFGASWGPVVWVLLGEIFPNSIRARALGIAVSAQWIANFLVTVSFPALAEFSLVFTYGMYAFFAAISFVFVIFVVPETNGMSLEQADTLFVRKKKPGTEKGR